MKPGDLVRSTSHTNASPNWGNSHGSFMVGENSLGVVLEMNTITFGSDEHREVAKVLFPRGIGWVFTRTLLMD